MNQVAISEVLRKTFILAVRNWRALLASAVYTATGLAAGSLAWGLRNGPDLISDPWARTIQPVLFAALLAWAAVGVVRGLDGKMYRPPAKDKLARPGGATVLCLWIVATIAVFSAILASGVVARLTVPGVILPSDCTSARECSKDPD